MKKSIIAIALLTSSCTHYIAWPRINNKVRCIGIKGVLSIAAAKRYQCLGMNQDGTQCRKMVKRTYDNWSGHLLPVCPDHEIQITWGRSIYDNDNYLRMQNHK